MTGSNQYDNTTLNKKWNEDFSHIRIGLLGMMMFGLAIVTIIGNTIVIYALRTDRHLRTVILMFV